MNKGTLDLAGFRLTGGSGFAVICEGRCTITGPGTINGARQSGILAKRVTLNNVDVTGHAQAGMYADYAEVTDSKISFNGGYGISVRKRAIVVSSDVTLNASGGVHGNTAKLIIESSNVSANAYGAASEKTIQVTNSTFTDNQYYAVFARRARIENSDMTANVWECVEPYCADINAVRLKAEGVTCTSSRVLTWPGMDYAGENWAICSAD